MLIEILKEPILVDSVPVVQNVRLNIAANNQLRLKATYLNQNAPEEHVDIVVFRWTIPKLDKLSLSITLDGKEMVRNLAFSLKLSYDFLHREWRLRGSFGTTAVNKKLEAVSDIMLIVRDLI